MGIFEHRGFTWIPLIIVIFISYIMLATFWDMVTFHYHIVNIFGLTWPVALAITIMLYALCFLFLIGVSNKKMWIIFFILLGFSGWLILTNIPFLLSGIGGILP